MNYKQLYDQAVKADKLERLDVKFIRLEEIGDTLIGRLLSTEMVQSQTNPGQFRVYMFDTDDGIIKVSFGASVDTNVYPLMKIGDIYRIEYTGKLDIGHGHTMNTYDIRKIILQDSDNDHHYPVRAPEVNQGPVQEDVPF